MKLVLLSSNFPFGTDGDNCFIQNEIMALSKKFEEIVIISTGNGKLRDDIPLNVRAIRIDVNKDKYFNAIKSLPSLFSIRAYNAFKELKKFYPKISFIRAYKQIFKYEFMNQKLKKVLLEEGQNSDLIYSYWMSSRVYSAAVLKNQGKIKTHIITRVHGFDCYLLEKSQLPYRNYIAKALDKIVFISNYGKEYYEKNIYPCFDKKCNLSINYLGLDKDAEYTNVNDTDVLKIVTCSSINEVKRLDILVDALSLIDNIKVEWVHFGDGKLKNIICRRAEEKLKTKENIKYIFKGNVKTKELLDYYRNNEIDLIVNCSDSEGVPVSIMEAYSFGIPAMARAVGGNPEIVCGNNNGFLLNQDADANDYANALVNFYNLEYKDKLRRREEVKNIFIEKFSRLAVEKFVNEIVATIK